MFNFKFFVIYKFKQEILRGKEFEEKVFIFLPELFSKIVPILIDNIFISFQLFRYTCDSLLAGWHRSEKMIV